MNTENTKKTTRDDLEAALGAALEASPIVIADRRRAEALDNRLTQIAQAGHPFDLVDAIEAERREADRALAEARKGLADWRWAVDQIDPALDVDDFANAMGALETVFGSGWGLIEELATARLRRAEALRSAAIKLIAGRTWSGLRAELERRGTEAAR